LGFDSNAGPMAAACLSAGTSSFSEFLMSAAPELLPGAGGVSLPSGMARELPHGTTIVAATFSGGVVMAGDRRATSGSMISKRDFEKVFRSDEFSCIGIAGTAGLALDLARLFEVELEHYEKLEGRALSLEGKANRLAGMVRANLGAAMQGLVVEPLFAGYDTDEGVGRIFSYDVTGGRYEQQRYFSIGSGSVFARGALKKLYSDGMESSSAVMACMEALYDAADDDSATGGPDPSRRIWPIVVTVTADGYQRLPDDESGSYAEAVINERMSEPDGPTSPMRPPAGVHAMHPTSQR
jgi:proteasome beta subunit